MHGKTQRSEDARYYDVSTKSSIISFSTLLLDDS